MIGAVNALRMNREELDERHGLFLVDCIQLPRESNQHNQHSVPRIHCVPRRENPRSSASLLLVERSDTEQRHRTTALSKSKRENVCRVQKNVTRSMQQQP